MTWTAPASELKAWLERCAAPYATSPSASAYVCTYMLTTGHQSMGYCERMQAPLQAKTSRRLQTHLRLQLLTLQNLLAMTGPARHMPNNRCQHHHPLNSSPLDAPTHRVIVRGTYSTKCPTVTRTRCDRCGHHMQTRLPAHTNKGYPCRQAAAACLCVVGRRCKPSSQNRPRKFSPSHTSHGLARANCFVNAPTTPPGQVPPQAYSRPAIHAPSTHLPMHRNDYQGKKRGAQQHREVECSKQPPHRPTACSAKICDSSNTRRFPPPQVALTVGTPPGGLGESP